MEKAEDFSLSSQVYRDELRRPKVKKVVEDGDEEEEPIEEEVKPLNESDLYFRPSEDKGLLQKQLEDWNTQFGRL